MAAMVIALLLSLLSLFFSVLLLKWNQMKYREKELPPGTMGWPVVGETTEFLKQGHRFMKNQRARFGSFFKTHFLGSPAIICMDPDLNRYIMMNEAKGFVPGYPQAMIQILGERNIAAVHGAAHKKMRGSLLSAISPAMIRDHLLPTVDAFMRSFLSNWEDKIIDIQKKSKEMSLLSSLKQVAGIESGPMFEALVSEFFKLVLGTFSLPINFPGTSYRSGLQARKNIVMLLDQLLQERKASKKPYNDMLGHMMKTEDNRFQLTDDELIDQIITIMYAGYETISVTSMMAVKYLHDHPKALEELRKEHLSLREKKKPDDPIHFLDIKSMGFTRAVIYETSRLATVVNGVLRKTTRAVELNGYTIPKDWRIYVYTRESNYDPCVYPEPMSFNPWRWLDKSLDNQNNFLFGGGTRLCPGKEFGVIEISTFLHYLVTRYRWEEIGGEKLLEFPRILAPHGLHMKFSCY